MDDRGATYSYAAPEGENENAAIRVAHGESLSGTFAFRGQIGGRPQQLTLVTNVYPSGIPTFDINDEDMTPTHPDFVVPFELTWG